MSAPQKILQLVERFENNIRSYRHSTYNETQARQEYINPFFKSLGWDVDNEQGLAEAYKDVIHEDIVKIGTATKSPDYSFRIGGTRKFFVEAKKPSVDIETNVQPAYQLRRYAWSAKLPLSILTDFEEFAVYDCRLKPNLDDKASTSRIMLLKFNDYVDKWDSIYEIFSKDAILKGSYDKFAETSKGKRGTSEVDDEFLKEIEGWRDILARNIAIRNANLTNRELNTVVQNTIDRLIFLRICEDRAIEEYGQLQTMLNGTNVYRRIVEIYYKADQKYNSGLFHFFDEKSREAPDTISTKIEIDDKPLKDIIKRLYYPESPYEFSVIPVEILGNVYERFLGKVIRLTAGHQAKIEEKPEVRKAGGVYYTPKYIVDYIVENTVGKLLENKTIEEVTKLKICDPACGSGSFLLGAYRILLEWHINKYIEKPEKYTKGKNPPIYQTKENEYRLTIQEKKRILLNNIYGVDIDAQAVEVTKLSLLLKALEGETDQTLKSLELFHERALPDLSNNIKCGNSLIGPDFYDGKEQLFDIEEQIKVNAFDWEKEFFEVFKDGGFDAVIGNPPWGAEIHKIEREYLTNAIPDVADFESSQYFILKSLSILNNNKIIGMILPNTFALNVFSKRCRERFINNTSVTKLVDLSDIDVFSGPNVRSLILISNHTHKGDCQILTFVNHPNNYANIKTVTRDLMKDSETWKEFFTKDTPQSQIINNIISKCSSLADFCDVRQGYIPYRTTTLTKRYGSTKANEIVKNRLWHSSNKETSEYLEELQGSDVNRYYLKWSGVWVRYGEWVSTYLPIKNFSGPRVLIREITGKLPHVLYATYTENVYVHNPSVLAVLPHLNSVSPLFLLGILNSTVMSIIFSLVAPKAKKGLFPKIIITDAKRLPFPQIDLSEKSSKSKHDRIVSLVEQMLELNKKVRTLQAHEKTVVERQIESTDRQIDKLVYELYALTDEEIKVVEGE